MKSSNKVFKIVLILSAVLLFFSSGCEDKAPPKKELNPSFTKPFNDLDQLQNDIENRTILKSTDLRSKNIAKTYLVELKNILVYLSRYPSDISQIKRALDISERLENLLLPLSDQARIYPVIQYYNFIVSQLAVAEGIQLNARNRTLFSYDFGNELSPFWSVSNKDLNWITTDGNAVNNQTKATARSSKFALNQAWLVSPKFNFKWISNPEVQLRQSVQINRGDGAFNRALILKNGYKLLVSDNYEYGAPLIFCEPGDSSCSPAKTKSGETPIHWRSLEFDKPKGDDFHMITTQPVSLKDYSEQENVFVALLLNFSNENIEDVGQHFNLWDIYEFKLLGLGVLPSPMERPAPAAPLFRTDFSKKTQLAPFESIKSNPEAIDWKRSEHRQVGHAIVSTNNTKTRTYLLATDITLNLEKSNSAFLNFDYTIKINTSDYDVWQRLKVKISRDYKKGMPFEEGNWQELEFSSKDSITEIGRYLGFKSLPIDISSFSDQPFSLAFEFNSEVSDDHIWQIQNIKIWPNLPEESLQ